MPWLTPVAGQPIDALFPADFLAHWRDLAVTTGQADPVCCSPAWQLSFHEVFAPERRVFYAASAQAAIIFAEYRSPDGRLYLLPLEDSWLFGQPLLGAYAPFLLAEIMPELLDAGSGKMPDVIISGIMEPSFFASALFQRFYPSCLFYRQPSSTGAAASLAGGLDGWMGRRSANHRAKLRKAAKHAHARGVVFERCRPDPGNARDVYRRMLAVEGKSWKGLGQCGMAESPSREFYDALIRRYAATDSALVIFATLENEDIGFIFGGMRGNIYRGQQFSYARTHAALSIGNLLQLQQIAWLCELGVERYDMGPSTGERMQYKKHWTEQLRTINTWIMRGRQG